MREFYLNRRRNGAIRVGLRDPIAKKGREYSDFPGNNTEEVHSYVDVRLPDELAADAENIPAYVSDAAMEASNAAVEQNPRLPCIRKTFPVWSSTGQVHQVDRMPLVRERDRHGQTNPSCPHDDHELRPGVGLVR